MQLPNTLRFVIVYCFNSFSTLILKILLFYGKNVGRRKLPNSMCKYIFCNQQQSFDALQNGNVSVSPNKYDTKKSGDKKTIDVLPATAPAYL